MALHEGNDVLYSRRGAGAQAMKGAGCASSHLRINRIIELKVGNN